MKTYRSPLVLFGAIILAANLGLLHPRLRRGAELLLQGKTITIIQGRDPAAREICG